MAHASHQDVVALETDTTHSVYTGYLDVDYGAKHMFFYFFESRRDPEKGMVWLFCTRFAHLFIHKIN